MHQGTTQKNGEGDVASPQNATSDTSRPFHFQFYGIWLQTIQGDSLTFFLPLLQTVHAPAEKGNPFLEWWWSLKQAQNFMLLKSPLFAVTVQCVYSPCTSTVRAEQTICSLRRAARSQGVSLCLFQEGSGARTHSTKDFSRNIVFYLVIYFCPGSGLNGSLSASPCRSMNNQWKISFALYSLGCW